MLGLHCCLGFSLVVEIGSYFSCGSWASNHGSLSCCGAQVLGCEGFSDCGSRALEHRLNSCGAQALLCRGMWDLPGPGIEPMSPALAVDSLPLSHQGDPASLFNFSESLVPDLQNRNHSTHLDCTVDGRIK